MKHSHSHLHYYISHAWCKFTNGGYGKTNTTTKLYIYISTCYDKNVADERLKNHFQCADRHSEFKHKNKVGATS